MVLNKTAKHTFITLYASLYNSEQSPCTGEGEILKDPILIKGQARGTESEEHFVTSVSALGQLSIQEHSFLAAGRGTVHLQCEGAEC